MIKLPHVKAKNGTGPLEYIKHARLSRSKRAHFVTSRHRELTSMSGLVNTAPAKAIELQHEAIQHSNVLSPGSHFNHSLFSATVPAGCKLCGAVINPCQVREEEEEEGWKKKNAGKRAEA